MSSPRADAKLLYRRLDSLFGTLKPNRPARRVLESFLEEAFRTLRDDLSLAAALLYSEKQDELTLVRTLGDVGRPVADPLPFDALPVRLVVQHGVYLFTDPSRADAPAQAGLLPPFPAAALALGRRPNRHVLLFLLREGFEREQLDFALNTVRAALGARLREERVFGKVKEAAEIQQSLLLDEPPAFAGYDLACRSLAAEEVGGDFYDFLAFGPEMLGVALGDASGHGLPAALLVRDVVTGLRMGIEKDLKVTYVFDKLNRVIHRSKLSSRFVSVFYGELEAEGNLIYVNAGHQPPLVLRRGGGTEALHTGGTVIGPLPETRFRRGFAHLEPGDVLVGCTDGILERRDASGEFYGEERFEALARTHADGSAQELLEAIYADAFAFGDGRAWEDDATLVVVKRLVQG
jgi:sigma-B regulation protein RsbU (phosphoserine phosphatase)